MFIKTNKTIFLYENKYNSAVIGKSPRNARIDKDKAINIFKITSEILFFEFSFQSQLTFLMGDIYRYR